MKKYLLVLLFAFLAIGVKAQFAGGFYEKDPNAWFDKEPFFACQNNYVYYGYGQSILNVSVVINNKDVYSFPYVWEYGSTIILGQETALNSLREIESLFILGKIVSEHGHIVLLHPFHGRT